MIIDNNSYYLGIAKSVSKKGTCIRRNYGAVIVKNDEIVATGYTWSPRSCKNYNEAGEAGECVRDILNIPSDERYELCRSVHAEQNAMISASRSELMGSTLYLYGHDVKSDKMMMNPEPCLLCKKMLINAGVEYVIVHSETGIDVTSVISYINNVNDLY